MKVFKKIILVFIFVLALTGLIGCKNDNNTGDKDPINNVPGEVIDKEDPDEEPGYVVPDEDQKLISTIDAILKDIIEQHSSNYLKVVDGNLISNYDYVAAIHLLSNNQFDIDITTLLSKEKVEELLTDDIETNTLGDAIRVLILTRAYELLLPNSVGSFVETIEKSGGPFSIPVELILLETLKNNDQLQTEALKLIPTVHETDWFSADTAGFIMAATSGFEVETSNLVSFIKQLTTEQGVKGWDDKPASETTAMVLLGYISQGLDISIEYEANAKVNLYEALMEFYVPTEKGFKSRLYHDNADLTFATPQVFAALALYRTYLLTGQKLNLYY